MLPLYGYCANQFFTLENVATINSMVGSIDISNDYLRADSLTFFADSKRHSTQSRIPNNSYKSHRKNISCNGVVYIT